MRMASAAPWKSPWFRQRATVERLKPPAPMLNANETSASN